MEQKVKPLLLLPQKMVKMKPTPTVKSNCLICNEGREFKCGLKENETFPILFNKMWTVFIKYFNLSPSKWEDILTFYNDVKELPFCDKCRNDVAQLLVFHEKVESFLSKIRKLTTNISAKIVSSQNTNTRLSNTASDSSDANQTVADADKTNSQLDKLRKHIFQRFDPLVTLINDQTVDSKLQEVWNEDEEEEEGEDNSNYNEDSNSFVSDSEYDDFEEGLLEGDDNDMEYDEVGDEGDEDIEDIEEGSGEVEDEDKIEDENEEDEDKEKEQEKAHVPANRICQICHMTFSTPYNLKRHSWVVHKRKLKFPRKQKRPSTDPDGILRAMPVLELGNENFEYAGYPFRNTETGYQCKTCDVKRNALAHILCHIRDEHIGMLGCPTGKRYETSKNLGNGNFSYLEKYLFTKTPDGFFICSTCDSIKNSRKNMVLHIKMYHAKDTTHICMICDRGFSSRSAYCKHRRSHKLHRYYLKPQQNPGDPETYIYDGKLEFIRVGNEFQCSTCKIYKNEKFIMAKHVRDKHIEPEFCKCLNCERQFTDRGSLRKHLKTKICLESKWHFVPNAETGEKDWYYDGKWPIGLSGGEFNDPECRYECKTCGQSRKERTSMATHIKQLHITPFSFMCQVATCAKRFLNTHYLNLHMARFHSDGHNFECEHCHKGFAVKRNLTIHLRNHHTPGIEKPCPKGKRKTRKQNYIMDIPSTSSSSNSMSQIFFIKSEPTAQNEMNDMIQIISTSNNNVDIQIDDSNSNFTHFINHIKTEDAISTTTTTTTFENTERDPLDITSGEINTTVGNEDIKFFGGISNDPLSINQDGAVNINQWTTFKVLSSEPETVIPQQNFKFLNAESDGAKFSPSILHVKTLHREEQSEGGDRQSSSRTNSRTTVKSTSYSEQDEIIIVD